MDRSERDLEEQSRERDSSICIRQRWLIYLE
jgi:hypothetical protein